MGYDELGDPVDEFESRPGYAADPGGPPLATIWFSPRATLRRILETDPTRGVLPLTMLAGIDQTLDRAATRNMGEKISTPTILGMAIVLGPLSGLFFLYVFGWIFAWAGRKLGGRGDQQAVRAAIAWAQVPAVFALAVWAVQIAVFGGDMFMRETPTLDANPSLLPVLFATGVVDVVLSAWSIALACKCMGEAHGFSAWRGLGTIFLGALAFIAPIVLVALCMALLAR